MPSTPYDAKGLFIASVYDGNPVLFIDDRWLYGETGQVPKEMYKVPIGKGCIVRKGKDVTIVTVSYMRLLAQRAAEKLSSLGIEAEIIDLRSVKPFDKEIIFKSLEKTGRLIVADGSWLTCGFAAEIAAVAASEGFKLLKAPVMRVTLPDAPAPTSKSLEDAYYPKEEDIIKAVKKVVSYS
jgi:pyruvate dehydrogenase E1 component beta subunit